MKWKSLSRVPLFATPWTIYSPWNFPGQSIGVGSLSLLQEIFPTQESNLGLPHCRQIFNQLSQREAILWKITIFSKGNSDIIYISINLVNGQLNVRWPYILISTSYFNLLWFAFRLKHMKKIWSYIFSWKTMENVITLWLFFFDTTPKLYK